MGPLGERVSTNWILVPPVELNMHVISRRLRFVVGRLPPVSFVSSIVRMQSFGVGWRFRM
eukprot:6584923-Prymnesium_polylepis.1